MLLVLMKVLLAPAVVLVASLLARRLGPRRGGFFVGLPTTSLPFLLVIWVASGSTAAVHAAAGSLTGQLTCALFCVFYSRTAHRAGPLGSMLLALAAAAAVAFSTLGFDDPVLALLFVVAAGVLGIATWPAQRRLADAVASRWFDIPLRMAMACLTVVVMSGIEPHVGARLAGALASLPTILMVMCPAVHASQGPAHAVMLARGTLGSIPGTAGFLACAVLLQPMLGMPLALLVGVLVIPVVTSLVARLGGLGASWRGRPAVTA